MQLVAHPDRPAFETLTHLRLESVICVQGSVVARPAETVNAKLATGDVEVAVESVEVLSSADVLPFPVERDTEVGERLGCATATSTCAGARWWSEWRLGRGWPTWSGRTWPNGVSWRSRPPC